MTHDVIFTQTPFKISIKEFQSKDHWIYLLLHKYILTTHWENYEFWRLKLIENTFEFRAKYTEIQIQNSWIFLGFLVFWIFVDFCPCV